MVAIISSHNFSWYSHSLILDEGCWFLWWYIKCTFLYILLIHSHWFVPLCQYNLLQFGPLYLKCNFNSPLFFYSNISFWLCNHCDSFHCPTLSFNITLAQTSNRSIVIVILHDKLQRSCQTCSSKSSHQVSIKNSSEEHGFTDSSRFFCINWSYVTNKIYCKFRR